MAALSRSLVLSCVVLATPATGQGKIRWATNFQEALAKAAEAKMPIVACISMAGERVCDVIVDEHYADSKIVALSRKTINLFCSPHGDAAQRELEKRVRIDLLKKGADDWMVAPQHVFFSPEGELIWAVPYFLSVGELEWTWMKVVQKIDTSFEWAVTDRVRAPQRLAAEETATVKEIPKPPTKKELEAILREIKRGFGGYYGARDKLPIIVRHPSSQAKKFVERILDSIETDDDDRTAVLSVIAGNSPRSWWTVVRPMLDREGEPVRIAAARALRALGEHRAMKALHSRWRKEKSMAARGALLHAMVACGPTDSKVVKLVPLVLRDYDDVNIRVAAAIAIASLENRKAVVDGLTSALADTSARVRSTAAWAAAARRETDLRESLQNAADREKDAAAKGWLDAACTVLDGKAGMEQFAGFPENVGGE